MLIPHTRTRAIRLRGFTLLELMITVALVGVVTTIAVPSFGTLITNTRISTKASALHTALYQARTHAITHHEIVTVCAAADASMTECEPNRHANMNWRYGWILYADANGNNRLDSSDQLIRTYDGDDGVRVTFNQRGRLRFFADGHARSAGFYVCSANSEKEAYIRLLHTGRARTSRKLNKKQRSRCLSSS
ncbi:hypothetical protein GCM10008090_05230 [Arenicella chitinivorans]|uniref:Type II secretion system protein H n=1 Tax=Arenicella chitinivorans TaxID=1329800 RepID=A0A918RIP9_9GAMM|nr:GspH/FimT family pseudopilin [Arenicella chitinivorans]GGZ99570.1 hypothetical protein GCM10008090_05230 [Arenicella chitinivorans]